MTNNTQYEFPSSRHTSTGYPYRVWLFTALTSPLLITVFSIVNTEHLISPGYVLSYFSFLFLSLVYFFPAVTVYLLIYWKLANVKASIFQKKVILAFAGVGSLYGEATVIKLLFTGNGIITELMSAILIFYAIALVVFSLFFALKEK